MKHIVIVGGSYAGIYSAHRILKQAAKTTTDRFKITLVSRDSHFYWSIAAPRGFLPEQIPDEKLFQPIATGFAHYPAGQFEFILGSAIGLDVETKQLGISGPTGQEMKLNYDFLILGTGSDTKGGIPVKSMGSTESTKDALHEFQAHVKEAEKIVVGGGGPTGVEIAGELGFEYGRSKEVILISSGATILDDRPPNVSKTALKQLRDLNVKVKLNTKVQSLVQLPDGRQEIAISGGEKLVADMYIPTFGVQPNSSYIPAKFLDANGFVKVDDYFNVKGANEVFAIGDLSNAESPQLYYLDKQSTHIAKNMVLALSGKPLLPYKAATTPIMGLQIGKKTGTGHFGNFKLPSFLVVAIRKTLFIERLPRTVNGSIF